MGNRTYSHSRAMATTQRQRGVGLVEIILGLAVLGLLMVSALKYTTRAEDQTAGRQEADMRSSFQTLASQYFLSNRTAIEKAMLDGTDADKLCKLFVAADGSGGVQSNSTTLHTCAFDATWMRYKKVWSEGLSVEAPGGRYVAIMRLVYDDSVTPAVPTGGVEGLVVLASPDGTLTATPTDARKIEMLLAGKDSAGGTGGYVPAGMLGDCVASRGSATYQACGNGWTVNLAKFIDPAQLTTFANALPD